MIDVRPDLVRGEWSLLFRRPVYAVVADTAFGEMLRRFFADVPGAKNLHILVLGRDDLDTIPDDAPTYVTQRVRATAEWAELPFVLLTSESERDQVTEAVLAGVSQYIVKPFAPKMELPPGGHSRPLPQISNPFCRLHFRGCDYISTFLNRWIGHMPVGIIEK